MYESVVALPRQLVGQQSQRRKLRPLMDADFPRDRRTRNPGQHANQRMSRVAARRGRNRLGHRLSLLGRLWTHLSPTRAVARRLMD